MKYNINNLPYIAESWELKILQIFPNRKLQLLNKAEAMYIKDENQGWYFLNMLKQNNNIKG